MTLTERLVLSSDVLVIRVRDLPQPVRDELGDEGAFALTMAQARVPSSLVDEGMAELLGEFRSPSTVVEAIIRYSRRLGLDPEDTLTDSYPALRRCREQGYLVPAGSERAQPRQVSLAVGQRVAGGAVVRCLHVLEDTELYQVALDDGGLAALKVLRPTGSSFAEGALHREVEILRHLDGRVGPRLLAVGESDDGPWLAMEWCDGVLVSLAAAGLRRAVGARPELLDLCRRVAQAYARLHELGVVHGDVHAGNVLVSPAGVVRLLDFGLARLLGGRQTGGDPPRGGVPACFDPQYASALRAHQPPPPASLASDQFSLGALLYQLLTGAGYLDLSIDNDELLRQIVEDAPLPFTRRGCRPWPEVEDLLGMALAKEPGRRLPSTAALSRRLAEVAPPVPRGAAAQPVGQGAGVEPVLRSVLANARPGGTWFEHGVPAAPFCSVVYGAAGVATALYRVGVLRSDPELLALADEWVVRAARESADPGAFTSDDPPVTEEITGRVSPFHRLSGVHAVQALVSHARGDPLSRQSALDAFVAESRQPCDSLDLTLGRAGTLLGAAILLEAVAGARYADVAGLTDLGNQTLAGLWAELDAMPPVGEGAAVSYLGVAHGWAGLLLATLRWCRATRAARPSALADRLDQLAAMAEPVGLGARWSVSNRHGGDGAAVTMAGWCNGSAGHVHLWTTAHAVLGDDRWARLAEQAAWHAYTTPNGIVQLCCGLAGQAYALLDLYRHSGEQRWLTAASEVATRAAAAVSSPRPGTLMPGSLHKGNVGVAVLAADLDDPEAASMPFFGTEP
jgi:eukaryotic-like serine/threonine-protein kinase